MPRLQLGSGIILILLSCLMCQSDTIDIDQILASHNKMLMDHLTEVHAEEIKAKEWVDAQFNNMDDEERLGQLFMYAAYPKNGSADEPRVIKAIQDYKLGGLIFFKGKPTQIARLSNLYQSKSKVPMMVAMDAEWGISMRVDSVVKYPRQLLLGAIQNNELLYQMGKEVAAQCRRIGVHINFAPVVDVNNNPANPVIGDRSFGESRENVTAKAFQYMKGMQDHGVMACAKHFPGHGDTDVDSHYDLPIINHSMQRLDSIELYPFKNLIQHGIQSIMIAHLHIPAIDTTANLPITLSKNGIQHLLKDSLQYKGLVFTDAMSMKGVTKYWEAGKADAKSLVAGTDVLLMTPDIPGAIKEIKLSIERGEISWEEIYRRCKKILRAKYDLGLNNYQDVSIENVVEDLNPYSSQTLHRDLVANAVTLVKNTDNYLPIENVRKNKIATLAIGNGRKTSFQSELDLYGIKKHYYAGASISGSNRKRMMTNLQRQEAVIVTLDRVGRLPKNDFNLSESARSFINELATQTKVILVVFGSPYSLKYFEKVPIIICSYNNRDMTKELTAQAIMGGIPISGRLPVSASPNLVFGMGEDTKSSRLPYAIKPEHVDMNSKLLKSIDKIANEAIQIRATPGCQIMAVKDGQIAFHKAYGYHTYSRRRKVKLDDVYDVASVTKIAAATISIMKLHEDGKLDITKPLSDYIPELKGTNKEGLSIQSIMAHQAGLKPWIPFYTKTLDDNKRPMPRYYQPSKKGNYTVRIKDKMYFDEKSVDSIVWQRIYDVNQLGSKSYKYSDLGFYLFSKLIKNVSGQTLDQYAHDNFYQPMGLEYITYNPLNKKIPRSKIIPTEEDDYFRYGKVHGDVHDMGAAMIDGVSGHAG
ncbi:MAG: serine hydrolase, partial [Saprospiraceae bacterium]|nr:serine hydrolase [Saprospiraceae bacterium]